MKVTNCWPKTTLKLQKMFKDTINPLPLFVEKRWFFNQNNQWLNNIINYQIDNLLLLNSIICFSVGFCDNSLLVLKMRFQVFSFANKKVQGFFSDRKILMSLLSVLFHLENCVSVFWNFNFWPRYLGKRSLCPWNQPHFLRNSDKSLLSPEQNKLKEIWDTVW